MISILNALHMGARNLYTEYMATATAGYFYYNILAIEALSFA